MDPEKPLEATNQNATTTQPSLPLTPGLPTRLFAPRTGVLRALRHRNYRLFWSGNFLSNIGTWMHQVALGWLVLEMTNSAFRLGLVGFMQWTPALLFSLPGGVIADRVNRRRLLLATHTIMLFVALLLAVGVSFELISYAHILLIAFGLGTASALNAPAYQAMVQDTSSKEDVLNAIALNSMQFNLSRFIGPTLAGVLVSTVGLAICFYINAVSFLAPILALLLLHYTATSAVTGHPLHHLQEGYRYLRSQKHFVLLISIVAMVSLFGLPYLILLPVFARDILEVGARGLGYMTSASGAGALLGAVVLASWPHDRRRGPLVLAGGLVFFAGVMVLALSKNFYLSVAGLLLAGGSMVCAVATVNSLIQTLVPDSMRGRVLSWHTMAYFGFSPLGSLLVGTLAEQLGTPTALALSAGIPLVILAVLTCAVPWLRHLQ